MRTARALRTQQLGGRGGTWRRRRLLARSLGPRMRRWTRRWMPRWTAWPAAALATAAARSAGAAAPAAACPCAAVVTVLTWSNVHRRDWGAADDYQDSDDRSSSPEAACGSGRDGPPPSFSRIDLALPPAQLKRRFPRFPGTAAALEVNLRAGAAWHPVSSMCRSWHATSRGELCWHHTGVPGAQARRSTSQPAGSMRSPASASAPRRTWR